MRVGYYLADQNPQRDRTLGVTTYTRSLLEQLALSNSLQITTIESKSSVTGMERMASFKRKVLPFRTDHSLGRILADQMHPALAAAKVDVWHYPKGFLPLALRYSGPIVGTVCDVILQHYADRYPHARSRVAYAYWLTMLKKSLPRFDLILTISMFSKRQIEEFCERYRIRCPKIVVTYLGSDYSSHPEAEKRNYVIHFASNELHKRTATLLAFWQKLESSGTTSLRLMLVGTMSGADHLTAAKLKSVEISERLPREAVVDLLRRARALLLTSEIEGFGLPALEAYAVGTPVVYVKGTTIEEILGTSWPGGFSLDSFESFSAALAEVLEMPRPDLERKREKLAEQFSWEKCAEQTLGAYESVVRPRG